MDALIKDLNANEAARLLILLDDRLTSLINAAVTDREPKPIRTPPPATNATLDTAQPAAAAVDTPAKPPDAPVRAEPPKAEQPPPAQPPAAPKPVSPARDFFAAPEATAAIPTAAVPSAPILTVPEPPKAPSQAQRFPRPPSFGQPDMPAAKTDGTAVPGDKQPPMPPPIPMREPAPVAGVLPPVSSVISLPAATRSPLPVFEPESKPLQAEADDAESDLVEEDLEDGDDLKEALDREAPKRGLAGMFSKLRLPGFSRRRAEATQQPQDERVDDDEIIEDDVMPDDELPPDDDDLAPDVDDLPSDEDLEDEHELAAPESAFDRNLRRLHAAADQLAANHLLDEAAERTGNRIELRKVDAGLDLVVKGLPKPLGMVRLSGDDGCAVYQPKFGLDLPVRAPNRADLEIWMKAMDDVVVRVLEDIALRRKSRGEQAGSGQEAP